LPSLVQDLQDLLLGDLPVHHVLGGEGSVGDASRSIEVPLHGVGQLHEGEVPRDTVLVGIVDVAAEVVQPEADLVQEGEAQPIRLGLLVSGHQLVETLARGPNGLAYDGLVLGRWGCLGVVQTVP